MKEYIRKNPGIILMLYFPVYLIWFALAEHFITDGYYVSYLPVDDRIPYVPAFVVPYVMWYPYILFPVVYLYIKDRRAYLRYAVYLITTLSVSLFVCCIFPNGQELRPSDTGDGIFGHMVSFIYAADTNTNVLPSMHVVTSLGAAAAYYDSRYLRKFAAPSFVLAILICASTVFIKQHSLLDVIWGVVLAAAVAPAVWFLPHIDRKREQFPERRRHKKT